MTAPLDIDAIDLVAQLNAARDQLDRNTDTLSLLADIRDDLLYRIRYRQLRMEAIDADTPIDDLVEEIVEFKRICAYLAWRSP
jgi:hypothetical protein